MRVRLVALSLALAFSLFAPLAAYTQQTPAEGSVSGSTFSSGALKLRFSWPSPLDQADPATAFHDGQINLPGLTAAASDQQGGSFSSCLRPILYLRSADAELKPASNSSRKTDDSSRNYATLLLAEIPTSCLSPAEQSATGPILPVADARLLAVPGITQASAPANYTVGGHKVFMVASQGHPQPAPNMPATNAPFTLYTMAVSAEWNNHLLLWLMTANKVKLLDDISKAKVQFGTATPSPLYPLHLNKSGSIQPPPKE